MCSYPGNLSGEWGRPRQLTNKNITVCTGKGKQLDTLKGFFIYRLPTVNSVSYLSSERMVILVPEKYEA